MIPIPILISLLATALADPDLKKEVLGGLKDLVDDKESEWDDITLKVVEQGWDVLVGVLAKRA